MIVYSFSKKGKKNTHETFHIFETFHFENKGHFEKEPHLKTKAPFWKSEKQLIFFFKKMQLTNSIKKDSRMVFGTKFD